MPEAVFTAEAEPESLLDVEEGATCWMTTLPLPPNFAPTKPPAPETNSFFMSFPSQYDFCLYCTVFAQLLQAA